jgi:hypothetical protein
LDCVTDEAIEQSMCQRPRARNTLKRPLLQMLLTEQTGH